MHHIIFTHLFGYCCIYLVVNNSSIITLVHAHDELAINYDLIEQVTRYKISIFLKKIISFGFTKFDQALIVIDCWRGFQNYVFYRNRGVCKSILLGKNYPTTQSFFLYFLEFLPFQNITKTPTFLSFSPFLDTYLTTL